ncbi:Ig-like domain-containing protein, partial [Campylobacter concisus]
SSVTAKIVDQAGNVGKEAKESLDVDLTDPETIRKPSDPSITFPEDNDPKDGKISDKENKAGDNDAGKTTAEISIPKDGSVKPGDKLVVTDENGKQTEKTIGQGDIDNGNIKVPVDLNPGKDNTITAEIINPNNPNNPGKGKGVIGEDSENTKAPEAPVINEVIDNVKGYEEDTKVGNVLDVKGHLTNDNTPTIKGTAKAGSKVEIYDNGNKVGETTAKSDGSWEVTTTALTKDGEHKFTATAENKFGKSAPSNEATIDLDSIAPKLDNVKITPIDTNSKADDTAELTMGTGHTDEPNAEILFRDENNNIIGKGHANSAGDFLIQLDKAVQPGTPVFVQAIDKAGNVGTDRVEAGNIEHPNDHTAPSEPTITFVEDTNPKDGKLNKAENGSDSDNANTTAKISIPADAVVNDVIKYTVNGGKEESHTITNADKTAGHVEIKVPVVDGQTSSVTAKIVDQAGNASKEVSGSIDVDTTAPKVDVKTVTPVDTNNPADGNPEKGIVKGHSDEPNAPVVVTDKDGKTIGTGTTDGNGDFTIETKPFNPGDKVNVEVTDKAGNKGNGEGTAGNIEHPNDHTAPSEPTITFVEDTNPKDGKLNKAENGSDSDNANTTAKISIPADAVVNDVIKYTVNGGKEESHTITNADKTAGHVEIKVPVVDGQTSSVTAKIVDQAGNASKEVSGSIDVDTTASDAPVITQVTDNQYGGIQDGKNVLGIDNGLTNDSTPTFKGTAEPNTTITLRNGNDIIGKNIQVDANGDWSYTPAPLAEGVYNVTAIATDKAGNDSKPSNVATITVDLHSETPVITEIVDNVAGGVVNGDVKGSLTNDNTPTLKGTAEPFATVEIKIDGIGSYKFENGKVISNWTAVADKDGNWEFTTPKLSDGHHNFEAQATDKAGNNSQPSALVSIDVDTTAGAPKVMITADADDNSILTATEASSITDGKLKWVIKLPEDAKVGDRIEVANSHREWVTVLTLSAADIKAGTIIRDDFSADLVKGKTGFQTPSYRIVDQAGNISAEDADSVKFDKAAPKAPVIKEVIDDVKGYYDDTRVGDVLKVEGGLTNDNTPTIKGTAEAGIKVDIYDNGNFIGTTKANTNGNWEFTPSVSAALPDGKHSITAVAKNALDVESAPSDAANIDVDTVTPKPTIDKITDNVEGGVYHGDVKGGLTNDNRPVFKGSAEKGAFIELFDNGKVIGTTKAGEDGKWTIRPENPMADGRHDDIYVRATDLAGNRADSSHVSSDVDTTPGVVKITAVCDDVAGYNGKVGNILGVNNGLTNDSTPTIKGTAKPGTTITIKDGNSVIDGVIKYNGDGSWEFTPKTPFADGEHKLTAIATSRTSGAQSVSNVAAIDVDTTIRIELTEVTPIAEGTTPGAHISTPTINFNTISGGNYVSQGDKSDYVKVNNLVSNCAKINLGNGNDTLAIGGIVENGVAIFAGKGNDKITIGEYLKGSLVDLGEGGANIVKTHLVGESDERNAKFIIKDKNNIQIGEGKTDADGKIDMYIDKVVRPGEKLSVEIIDAAGNRAIDSKVASHVEISTASRYYDNELDVGTNIHAAAVVGRDGNDLVVVGEKGKPDGYITGGSKIELGEGDNEIRVRTNIDHSEIKTGSGDDIVTTGLKGGGDGYILNSRGDYAIDLGDGNNKLTVGTNIQNSEIKTGSGDDIVNVGVNGIDGYITEHSKVELGDGNNTLNVRTNITNSKIITGDGNDFIEIEGGVYNSADITTGAGNDTLTIGGKVESLPYTRVKISTGDGNDSVTIKGDAIDKAKIDLGNGDDTLTIKAAHVIGGVDDKGALDGGKGYDKLIISSPEDTIDLKHVSYHAKNFEELDISGAKNTTLNVSIKDVLEMTDGKHTLKITGDKGDVVDLKDDVKGSVWHQGASEDGYTTYTNNTVTIQIKDEIHVI